MLDGLSLELYRYAVGHPGWSRRQASDALGYTLRDIENAMEDLFKRKLLSPQAANLDGFVAISPDVALADLVDADEKSVLELKSRINGSRRELSSLIPAYLEARKSIVANSSVEVLEDPQVVRRVLIDYGREVIEKVFIAAPGQGANADVQEESVRKDLDLLQRGVERKSLYDISTRDHVPTRKAVMLVSEAGGKFGVLPYVPLRMVTFDQKLALVARQSDHKDKAALVIRDPNLVHIFTQLFEFTWELSEPFLTASTDNSPLTSTQQAILQGLASGYSDEVIARRLNINVRTCRRHIAWVLEKLNAESRFQAGIKARDAGWV